MKAILRLRNARSSALDDASSSAGTSRGSASTMVTSAPNDVQTLANSHADHAAAEHDRRLGHVVQPQRVLAGDHPSPSISRPGREREYEPVARTTLRPA